MHCARVHVCGVRQAAWRAGSLTTLEFLLPAAGEQGSSLPVLLSKTMAGWLLTTLLTHPLDVVAARAAAGRPRGQKWEWTGAWPSMAYVMLGLPVRVILVGLLSKRLPFFDLAVRCGASLRTAARGALAPALAARLEGAACRPQAGRHGAAGLHTKFRAILDHYTGFFSFSSSVSLEVPAGRHGAAGLER